MLAELQIKVKTWLQILLQSDLKTPYGKDSMMAGSKNFHLVGCQTVF